MMGFRTTNALVGLLLGYVEVIGLARPVAKMDKSRHDMSRGRGKLEYLMVCKHHWSAEQAAAAWWRRIET